MRWHNPYRPEPNLNRSQTWCIRAIDTGEKVRDHIVNKAQAMDEARYMNALALKDLGRCFACGKALTATKHAVWTCDGQVPWVGPECHRKVVKAGDAGWQPTAPHGKGGPRLFPSGDRK